MDKIAEMMWIKLLFIVQATTSNISLHSSFVLAGTTSKRKGTIYDQNTPTQNMVTTRVKRTYVHIYIM